MHKLLAGHECATVQKCGWSGIKNGELLRRAEGQIELFSTADQNIRYQLNLTGFRIAILELPTNDLRRIPAAAALIRSMSEAVQPGQFQHLDIP